MTYFILGLGIACILFVFYMKTRTRDLLDKEREKMIELKEQQKETARLEDEYERRKKRFFDLANEFERAKQPGANNENSKL